MWLISIAILVCAGIVLRRTRDWLAWTPLQRWVVALLPVGLALLGVVVLFVTPSGMQVTDRESVNLTGVASREAGMPRPATGGDAARGAAIAIGVIGLAILLAPVGRGVHPWPRRKFAAGASVLTALSVLSFSAGVFLFPAALAAWIPVLSGPRS